MLQLGDRRGIKVHWMRQYRGILQNIYKKIILSLNT